VNRQIDNKKDDKLIKEYISMIMDNEDTTWIIRLKGYYLISVESVIFKQLNNYGIVKSNLFII